MSRRNEAFLDKFPAKILNLFFVLSIQNGGFTLTAIKHDFQVFGSSQFFHGKTDESNLIPGFFKSLGHDPILILDQAHNGYSWGWVNCLSFCFIIEADVTADYRNIKKPAGIAHAFYRLLELPHDFGFFRIAEIQTIAETNWFRAGAHHIPAGFGNSNGRALIGVEVAVTAVAVYRNSHCFLRILYAQDSCVRTGQNQRVQTHHVVVLLKDPFLAGDIGAGQKFFQSRVSA